MRYLCKIHEGERYFYLYVSTHFEQAEIDTVHAYDLWNSMLANVTPPSFREQFQRAKAIEARIKQLHEVYRSLPFFGYDADKDDIKRELAELENSYSGVPTHNIFWLVRPARLIENPLLKIPFADYGEAHGAERTIDRALRVFARKLDEFAPEPQQHEPSIEEIPWFDDELRCEGVWIIGHPGAGKTQALQTLLQRDLERMADGEKVSILVMDNQGNTPGRILHNLAHQRLFAPGEPLHGRLTYISARNPNTPLNVFDLGFPGGPAERYEATHELLEFVLTGLMGDAFTPPMRTLFTRCVRVLMERPGATLIELSELLEDPEAFEEEIARTSRRTQRFFEGLISGDQRTPGARQTMEAVINRLDALDCSRILSG